METSTQALDFIFYLKIAAWVGSILVLILGSLLNETNLGVMNKRTFITVRFSYSIIGILTTFTFYGLFSGLVLYKIIPFVYSNPDMSINNLVYNIVPMYCWPLFGFCVYLGIRNKIHTKRENTEIFKDSEWNTNAASTIINILELFLGVSLASYAFIWFIL